MYLFQSNLERFLVFRQAQGIHHETQLLPSEIRYLMQAWHRTEPGGLQLRLEAMRMFPLFFKATRRPRDIDGRELMDCMKNITEAVDYNIRVRVTQHSDRIWSEGGATRLLVAIVDSHVESLSNEDVCSFAAHENKTPNQPFLSSWSSLAASVWIYLHGILEVSDTSRAIQSSPLRSLLWIIKRDVDHATTRNHTTRAASCIESRNFEFWKSFTATLALARHRRDIAKIRGVKNTSAGTKHQEQLQSLQRWFEDRVRSWSEVANVSEWAEAKAVLQGIAWPAVLPGDEEDFSEAFWDHVVSTTERM